MTGWSEKNQKDEVTALSANACFASNSRKMSNRSARLRTKSPPKNFGYGNFGIGDWTRKLAVWRQTSLAFGSRRLMATPVSGGSAACFPKIRKWPEETTLAGWGARIRTWEWRNQNPRDDIDRVTYFSRLPSKATVLNQYVAGRLPTAPGPRGQRRASDWTNAAYKETTAKDRVQMRTSLGTRVSQVQILPLRPKNSR